MLAWVELAALVLAALAEVALAEVVGWVVAPLGLVVLTAPPVVFDAEVELGPGLEHPAVATVNPTMETATKAVLVQFLFNPFTPLTTRLPS